MIFSQHSFFLLLNMIHYKIIGHFDPANPLETSQGPAVPKPKYPIPQDKLYEYVKNQEHGDSLVLCEKGYFQSYLSALGGIHPFEKEIADKEGCLIMTEMFQIVYPFSLVGKL